MAISKFKKGTFVKIPFAILTDPKLDQSALHVYGAIRSFGNWKNGARCFPSRKRIAERACCSVPTVDVQKRALKKKGYLDWKSGKTKTANEYSFPLEQMFETESPAIAGLVTDHADIALSMMPHQETYTDKQNKENLNYFKEKNRLFYGNEKCTVLGDGTIKIKVSHLQEWKIYGGRDDEKFRFNNFKGSEAIHAALDKYAPNR